MKSWTQELGEKQDKMYARLKSMRVNALSKEPDWKNCIHVSTEDYLKNKEAAFQNLAGFLIHKNKEPLEIGKFENTIFVKTD